MGGNDFSLGYIGLYGRNQARLIPNLDLPLPPLSPGGCGQTTILSIPGPCQPYYAKANLVSFIQYLASDGILNYNGLQARYQRRFSKDLGFDATYTWAHGLSDNGNGSKDFCKGCGLLTNNPGYDYGSSNLDVRNRFTATADYVIPFAKNLHGFSGAILDKWQVNGIFVYGSGLPFTVVNTGAPQSNQGVAGTGTSSNASGDRPNVGGARTPGFQRSLTQWSDIKQFQLQPFGTPGNESRNPYTAPNQKRFDFSLFKEIPIHDQFHAEFRWEVCGSATAACCGNDGYPGPGTWRGPCCMGDRRCMDGFATVADRGTSPARGSTRHAEEVWLQASWAGRWQA